jgi:hypothetical protein
MYGRMLHFDGMEWRDVSISDDWLFCVWGTSEDEIIVGGFSSILMYSEQ